MNKKAQVKFNLLTPKSKDEIAIEQERDNSLLYSTMLIFVSVLAFSLIFLFNNLFLQPRVNLLQTQVEQREKLVASYNPVKQLNGELFIKTQTLSTVLAKRINTEAIFSVADELISGVSNAKILQYNREKEGNFVFNLQIDNLSKIVTISNNIKDSTIATNFFVREVSANPENNTIQLVVSLNINATI